MSRKYLLVLVLLALAWSAAAETPTALRRFAFVAGSNDGGEGLERLRYAESDARSFATVLQDLGGVRQQDLILVTNPSLQRFRDALQRARQMVGSPREMDERRELVFYYSGHSDDDGIILGKERVRWGDIRADLASINADIKVAIVDSCSSGSLTRAKGGVTRPAFLFDASSDMTGHAYLTSASAEEAAQESDRIGSSFFTHFLISGLRGAADAGGDGVVTLEEAYAYAYKETLASTEKTQYGPQ
ncbi:MAG TPA: caspase family protein, partial [Spirochaetia bacterium]